MTFMASSRQHLQSGCDLGEVTIVLLLLLIFIGVQLLYSVVLFSTVQQSESAICLHMFPYFLDFFTISVITEHRVPCAIQQVFMSYFIDPVYICQFQSPSSSHQLPFHLGIHMFIPSVFVSISALQIRSPVPFFLDSTHMC